MLVVELFAPLSPQACHTLAREGHGLNRFAEGGANTYDMRFSAPG
jgi:hypothetical protein